MVDIQQTVVESPRIGLNLVADPLALKPGEYTHMLNGTLYDADGKAPFARMFRGNRKAASIPAGYYPVGNANISQRETCLFLVNPSTGDSEIGIFDKVSYRKISGSLKLGFRIDRQIQAVVDEDYNGAKTVIWVQVDAPVRFMDLNNPPMLNGELDIDALNVFRKFSYPGVTVSEVTNNGRLVAGTYYISVQYSDENGNALTSASTPVGPINIYRDPISQPIAYINGSPDKEPTDKAIRITLSNLDRSFKYANILVVKSFSGIRSAVIAATVPTFQESYLYTGNPDSERDITLEDVITPGVSYSSAKTIALSNGVALIGNLKGRDEFNFQPFITQIGVQWQIVKERYDDSSASYANPLKGVYMMQYRRNEVYDLGISIRWNDGTKSRVYPLIAREKDKTSRGVPITLTQDQYGQTITGGWDSGAPVLNDDVFETGSSLERWNVMNTAFVSGDDLPAGATEGASLYGEFGYWESSSDVYPVDTNVWGTNAGKPIRRFMMPDHSVAPLIDGENQFRTEKDITSINMLGIRFDNIEEVMNSLPADIKSQISGYELVRADRRNNKSIIGSGIIFNMFYQRWKKDEEPYTIFDGMGAFGITSQPEDIRLYANYPFNDLTPDYLIKKKAIGTEPDPGEQTGNDRYRKDVFTFLSPDTSFNKNLLFTGEMLIHNESYGVSKNALRFVEPYPQLKDVGDDYDLSAYHNLSVGYYNNWKRSRPGTLRREIREAMYVPFNSQVSSGIIGLPIHNTTRESTVVLMTGKEVNDPTMVDKSRSHLTDPDFGCFFNNTARYRTVSSYYVSLVSRIGNQYGGVFDPRYLYTNWDSVSIRNKMPVFGGDSYIAPFSIKRQLVLQQNAQAFMAFEDGASGIDLKNSETIAGTRYYYEAVRRNTNRDSLTECENGGRLGYLPMIYTGIPIIFTESDYNIDLRINGIPEWETYYPNLKDASVKLEDWTGIKNVDKDNDFSMNSSYNEQNDLYAYANADPFYNPLQAQKTHYATRVIASLPGKPENRFNNLLAFLPLNYYDFPRDCGELTDIRDVGNYEVLFRLQHAMYRNRVYASLSTSEGTINIGSGKLFETAPVKLATTDGGYAGSSEQWAYNNTPYGGFCVDALRRTAFSYTGRLNDIGINDASVWLAENMPYNLLKAIPGFVNTDNPANPEGIGFHSVFDPKTKMWLLTKIDYEVIDTNNYGRFTMVDGTLYLNGGPVSLSNRTVFRDRSWTFAYSPLTSKWITWLSFTPEMYFQMGDDMYSVDEQTIWCFDNPLPRTYNGIRYPFEIEVVLKTNNQQLTHTSSFLTRVFPFVGGVQQGEDPKETFNKASIYNLYQHSGQYILTVQDEDKLSQLFRNPDITNDSIEVYIRKLNHTWNIDQIYDKVKDPTKPFFLPGWEKNIDHSNIVYSRDYKEAAILRDLWAKHRLRYDREKDVQLNLYLTDSLTQISGK